MITGDNLLTAMSVARECGIIRPHKRAFLLEAIDKLRSRDGRTYLSLKQSVSSSHDLVSSYYFLFVNYRKFLHFKLALSRMSIEPSILDRSGWHIRQHWYDWAQQSCRFHVSYCYIWANFKSYLWWISGNARTIGTLLLTLLTCCSYHIWLLCMINL